jgi:tight adherence protein C
MPGSDLILWAALAAIGVSAGMIAYLSAIATSRDEVLATGGGRGDVPIDTAIMKPLLALAKAIAPLYAGVEETPKGKELLRRLKRAGRPFGMDVATLLALRFPAAAAGALLGYGLSIAYSDQADWTIMLPITIFGFLYPTLRLGAIEQKRMRRIFRDLPYTIDLLTLSTEAGQDFSSAMATVVEKGTPGPLLDEFRVAHQEVILGKSRADSLRGMADRLDLPEVTSFVLALLQAEQLGTGVGNVLRVMSEQTRQKRWQLAEEAAGRVPVKLMMPLIGCVFPASFIILFVPLVLQTWMME